MTFALALAAGLATAFAVQRAAYRLNWAAVAFFAPPFASAAVTALLAYLFANWRTGLELAAISGLCVGLIACLFARNLAPIGRISLFLVIGLTAVMFFYPLWLLGDLGERLQPRRWIIPAGYTGTVTLRYADPACAPLPVQDSEQVITVGPNGQACTSDPNPNRPGTVRQDRFDRLTADGGRERLEPGASPGVWGRTSDEPAETLFVGSFEAFRAGQ
jgi:hypothetical protein